MGPWVGLTNYRKLWQDKFFRRSLVVTTKFTLGRSRSRSSSASLAAILLNRLGAKAAILTGLVLLPWIMPDIVRAITWKSLLDPLYGGVSRGLVNLHIIKAPIAFLGDMKTALPSVVLVNLWQGIPFFTINLLAGLKSIDQELYEAAAIDGASSWRQFLHITLPGLRYVLIVVTLLSTIWTFNTFTLIFLLTGGGPMDATKVYSIYAYQLCYRRALRYGLAIAVALITAPVLARLHRGAGPLHDAGAHALCRSTSSRSRGRSAGALATHRLAVPDALRAHRWPSSGWSTTASRRSSRRSGALIRGCVGCADDDGAYPPQPQVGWQHAAGLDRSGPAARPLSCSPFYWVIVTGFKTELQITRSQNIFWPSPWTLDQFRAPAGPAAQLPGLAAQHDHRLRGHADSSRPSWPLPAPMRSPACAGRGQAPSPASCSSPT